MSLLITSSTVVISEISLKSERSSEGILVHKTILSVTKKKCYRRYIEEESKRKRGNRKPTNRHCRCLEIKNSSIIRELSKHIDTSKTSPGVNGLTYQ